jgi:hypothetical protein
MKKIILPFIVILFSFSSAQTFEWVNIAPLDIQTNPAYLHSTVTTDNSGNPVCARLVEYIDLYGQNYFGITRIEKRNDSGSLLWENIIEGKADVSEIIVDGENNTVCIGTYRDTITIDSQQLINTGIGMGSLILKLDTLGNLIWIKDGTDFFSGYEIMTALEKDGLNNYLVGISNYPISSAILRLDTGGNLSSTIDQPGVNTVSDIDMDTFANIWVTGFTSTNNQSFNGLDTISPFTYTEYVVKYNSAGTAHWVNFIEDITVQDFIIETDDAGNGYLSGNIFTETNFGNLVANGPQWVYDFFVTKISPDGNFIWLNEIPPGNTTGDATTGNSNFLFCNSNGDTYLTGFFRGTINFGNGVTLSPVVSNNDLYVLNYNTDGIIQWAKAAGSNTYDNGSSITDDENGNIYLVGFVGESSVFDTITVSGDYVNIFLAKLNSGNVVLVENGLPGNESTVNSFVLYQNYPNPFNPSTKIKFEIPFSLPLLKGESETGGFVTLKVYDVLGNEVATLVNEEKPAGTYEVEFISHSDEGQYLSSGVYFYQLRAGGPKTSSGQEMIQTKKMMLLR